MANVSSSNGLEKYPKLRFKGFSEPWNAIRFGDIVDEYSDRTKEENEDILLSAAIEGMFLNSELFDHQRGASNKGYKKIDMGTLVLSTQNLHLGNANVNLRFEHGMVSPAYKTYHIHDCSIGLIAEWVKSEKAKRFFYDATTVGASVCRRNVEWDTLYDQSLYLPSEAEQERLATFLTALTTRIKKQTELVEHLKKYKRGVSIAIFDRKISLTKNSPSWIKTTVGEICKITMGQSPDSESYNTDQIGIPLVQGNADMKNRITCPQRYTSKPTKICEKGSIILSVRAPVGSVGRADRTVCLGRGVCAINSDNNDFLYYFFERNEPYWKRIEQGGTFTAISGDDIADMPIDYPSLEERQKIADFLLKIDTHIAAEQNTLDQFITLKSGLLQQLFT